jgi:hypothetical protein
MINNAFVIISLLVFGAHQTETFDLKADIKKDNIMLQEQHGVYVDKTGLNEFKPYINLNLSKFRFSKQISGKHSILKWTSTSGAKLIIYEVKSIVSSDETVYQDEIVRLDSGTKKVKTEPGEKIKLKPVDFTFHTYIIQPGGSKQLIYMTERYEGLMEYHIGNKIFYPVYEDIALGLKTPDMKELLKLIAAVK